MRSESTCVSSKNGHAQREQPSDGTASPLLACPPTHLRQTHTHFVKRRDSWRDRRLTEGKAKPKGYGGIARGRDTSQPRAEGEAELGLGRGAAAKILPRAHTKKKNIKVGHRWKSLSAAVEMKSGRRGSATPLHGHLAHMKRSIRLMNSCTAVINNSGD